VNLYRMSNKLQRSLRRKPRQRRTRRIRNVLMDAFHLKKILGGGDFSDSKCDFTPLTLEEVEKYDREPPEVIGELNLMADNTMREPISGSFNTVITVKCKTPHSKESRDTVLIYRKSNNSLTYDEAINEFRKYHEEMKIQIGLAREGVAPHVYMYGLIEDPDYRGGQGSPLGLTNPADIPPPAPPALGLMNPATDNTSPNKRRRTQPNYVYIFSVMEYKISAFDEVAKCLDAAYAHKERNNFAQYENEIKTSNVVFKAIYDLLKKLAKLNYLVYDIKLDNIVLDLNPDSSYTAYLIDCDPAYIFPNDIITNAMTSLRIREDKRSNIYGMLLYYIFSAKTLATFYNKIEKYNYAIIFKDEEFVQKMTKYAILQEGGQQYGKNFNAITGMLNVMATNRTISTNATHRQKFREVLYTNALSFNEGIPRLPFRVGIQYLTKEIAEQVPPQYRIS